MGMATWAVLAGLLAGKFAGIYFFTWLVIKMGFAGLLKGMTWVNLTGICLLGGIGFTVSLFIANLSFGDSPVLLTQAKMGVILGTVLAGVLAYLVLQFALPNSLHRNKITDRQYGGETAALVSPRIAHRCVPFIFSTMTLPDASPSLPLYKLIPLVEPLEYHL